MFNKLCISQLYSLFFDLGERYNCNYYFLYIAISVISRKIYWWRGAIICSSRPPMSSDGMVVKVRMITVSRMS